ARGAGARAAWAERLAASPERSRFEAQLSGTVDTSALDAHIAALLTAPQKIATRKASELALAVLTEAEPKLIGGSADLTGSNFTITGATAPLTRDDYAGRYLYYGIREFGMAAAMNGMALHGGVVPYGGTFLVFADYSRPAIRLGAIQHARVVHVMTHDSIGVGEDGPTHQPIEHLMSLRAIPGLDVYRPCDAVETAECWALALARADGPSLLALSRQNLPQLRTEAAENRSERGAYRLRAATAPRRVVLVATGSEVSVAVEVATALEAQGIGADVVSMPSWERFFAQDAAYRQSLFPDDALRVSIEAGTTFGWERVIGSDGLAIGIDRFGASGPAADLYDYFGLTAAAVLPLIIARL
ncbi:transketolase C-terminal domain-containing protein, partial [Sphingomonas sp.]|uniref:transketolase-like TK C-terminal-containing protein n=1 Tax=Sphingomonas sp. TaxID=28214 RepID=UPI001DBA9796